MRRYNIKGSVLAALFFTTIILVTTTACSSSSDADSDAPASAVDVRYTHLSMEEARNMIESGVTGEDYILLDTRAVSVYEHDHIPGAICIPEPDISALSDDDMIEALPNKEQKIIVYCQYGGVSKVASEKLCDMGYTNIYEFDGMDYWDGEVEYGDKYL